jgi:hypothetical protein
MAKAAAEGIPLGDYIKFHAPETFVRGQLDRNELPYAWQDIKNTLRTSSDGGEQPPKGWWTRPEFTTINRETSEVRGNPQFAPHFPPMFFVRVFPAVAPADTPSKAKRRFGVKFDLVLKILADIDRRGGLASNLQPAEVQKKVLSKVPPEFRRRWEKLGPDGRPKPPVSRTQIYRAYQEYLNRSK